MGTSRRLRSSPRLTPLVVALPLALALAAGCKDRGRDRDDRRLTATSTDDATAAIVDEDYRFRLGWPGPGWKLAGAKDAARINQDAAAAAVRGVTGDRGSAIHAVVIVESAPGSTAAGHADLLIENISLSDPEVEARRELTFAGVPAVRFVLRGTLDGIETRMVTTTFVHQGFAYQLVVAGLTSEISVSGREAAAVFDAFSLLPGDVKGRSTVPVVTDADGLGWRVRGGRFDSAISGVRVTAASRWRLLVGRTLAEINDDAEVGLTHVDPEVQIILIAEQAPAPAQTAALVAHMAQGMEEGTGGARGTPWTGTVAGADLPFVRVTTTAGIDYLQGVVIRDGVLVQVLTWFSTRDRDRAEAAVREGLAMLAWVPPAERELLRATLATAPDTQAAVGADSSLRGRTYRNFAHRWRWRAPRGFWRFTTGDAARTADDAEVTVDGLDTGLYLAIHGADANGATAAEVAATLAAELEGASTAPPIMVGTTLGHRFEHRTEVAGEPYAFHVVTAVEDDHALTLSLWGRVVDVERNAPLVEAALAGLAFDPAMRATQRVAGEYVDQRMGFAFRLPAGATVTDDTPAPIRAMASVIEIRRGEVEGMIAAIHGSTHDEDWFVEWIEQTFAELLGDVAGGRATRSGVTVGGRPARKLAWGRGANAYIVNHHGTAYVLVQQRLDLARGFRLLD